MVIESRDKAEIGCLILGPLQTPKSLLVPIRVVRVWLAPPFEARAVKSSHRLGVV